MRDEKRRYLRVSVDVNADVWVQIEKKFKGRVTNISEAGLFVETAMQVQLGSFVLIKLSNPEFIFGMTVRQVARNGFGAEFGSMSSAHREGISTLVKKQKQATVTSVVETPTLMLLSDNALYPILVNGLKAADFSVLEISDLDSAISSMDRFDVVGVISDYVVGGKDTFPTLKKIKELKSIRNFPVIMYSGRYVVPSRQFEDIGIQCFSKSSTTIKTVIGHIKRSLLTDEV